jgi:biopolymer transport protein ExbD
MRLRLGGSGAPMLKMTALMDIFSTLLLFLLKSFVAEGQASTVTPGVTLPSSVAQSEPHEAPVLAVTQGFIALEGEAILSSEEALQAQGLELPQLYEALVAMRQTLHEDAAAHRVIIQGDRGIPFRLLQRVMYTSQLAGWTDVSLAVIQDGRWAESVGAAESSP